jgi:hypothetical protein
MHTWYQLTWSFCNYKFRGSRSVSSFKSCYASNDFLSNVCRCRPYMTHDGLSWATWSDGLQCCTRFVQGISYVKEISFVICVWNNNLIPCVWISGKVASLNGRNCIMVLGLCLFESSDSWALNRPVLLNGIIIVVPLINSHGQSHGSPSVHVQPIRWLD